MRMRSTSVGQTSRMEEPKYGISQFNNQKITSRFQMFDKMNLAARFEHIGKQFRKLSSKIVERQCQ